MLDEVNDLSDALFEEAQAEARKGDGLGYGVHLVVLDKGTQEPSGDGAQDRPEK